MNALLIASVAIFWVGASLAVAGRARGAGRMAGMWLAASLLASPAFTYGLLVLLEMDQDEVAHRSSMPI